MESWYSGPIGIFIQKQFISFVFVAITYFLLNRYAMSFASLIVVPLRKIAYLKGRPRQPISSHSLYSNGSENKQDPHLVNHMCVNLNKIDEEDGLYINLAEDSFKRGDSEKAFTLLEKATDWFPSLHTLYKAGVLYQKLGQKEKAREIFKVTVEDYRAKLQFRKRAEWRWAFFALLRSLLP